MNFLSTLGSSVRLSVIGLFVLFFVMLLPSVVLADANITSLSLTTMDTGAASGVGDVELSMVVGTALTAADGKLWVRVRSDDDPDPSASGAIFTGSTLAVAGISGTQLVFPSTGDANGLFFNPSDDISPGTYSLTLSSLENSSTANCAQIVASSESFLGPNTEYAATDYFSIGGATGCDTLGEETPGDGDPAPGDGDPAPGDGDPAPGDGDAGGDGDPVDGGSGDAAPDDGAVLTGITATVFGTNVEVRWPEYAGVEIYRVILSPLPDGITDTTTTGTSLLLWGFDPKTDYTVMVTGSDSVGDPVIVPYAGVDITTEKAIADQRFNRSIIKKRQKRKYRVNYKTFLDRLVDREELYIDRIALVVKNSKRTKVKNRFKSLSADNVKKNIKKKFTKKNRTYYVRLRAFYTTGEKTKWSRWTKARLKRSAS